MNLKNKVLKFIPAAIGICCIILISSQLFISCGANKGLINHSVEVNDRYLWGNVPDSILAREQCPYDSSAAAMMLLDIGNITISSDEFRATFERHKRIQIFKEEGREQANIRIPYLPGEEITSIKAQVILPSGKIRSVKNEDIREEGMEEGWKYKVFTVPNVKENCVIEYQYSKINKILYNLPSWRFQNELYTKTSRLTLKIGAGFTYDYYLDNPPHQNCKPKKKQIEDNYSDETFNVFTWEFEDLEPVKKIPFMTAASDYKTDLKLQLNSYKSPLYSSEIGRTWKDISNRFLENWEDYFEPSDKVSNLADKIIDGANSDQLKAQRLYKFVRDSIIKEEEKGVLRIKPPEEIISSRSSSRSGKNLLLCSLMRSLDLNAKMMMVSTRSNGKINRFNPRHRQFDHTIVRLSIDDEKQYLDCSSKYYPYGLLPFDNYTNAGFIIGKNLARFENLIGMEKQNNIESLSTAKLDKEGDLEVISNIKYAGYLGVQSRKKLDNSEDAEKFAKKYILSELEAITLDSIKINNQDSLKAPLSVIVKYSLDNYANVANNFIYLNPNLVHKINENPFKLEDRDYPVEYPYRFTHRELVSYEIPQEYSIVETPNRCDEITKGVQYETVFATKENRLEYKRIMEVYEKKIHPRYYNNLKSLYGNIVNTDGQQVVLKKDK